MKTKICTDIEQSKKLTEFLPLESADHHYVRKICDFMGNPVEGKWSVPKYGNPQSSHANYMVQNFTSYETIPAWSLSALISILPRFIEFKDDKYYLRFMKEYVEYANDEISITGRCLHTTGNNNLVDACVEMISKLNKLKLL